VHVHGFKTRLGEGVGHFHMRIHALLAQYGHPGARQHQCGCGEAIGLRQEHMQARIRQVASGGMFGIGASRVVALLADFPAHGIPDLVQVLHLGLEHRLGVAPDLHFALADLQRRMLRPRLANKVAATGQVIAAQGLHDVIARSGPHLNDHAQFFAEQCLEREFFPAATDLRCPIFTVARVHAAVADAVALQHQHVDVERHADVAGKGHFADCRKQAAVAAVVVRQNLALRPQIVDGPDQIDQVFRVVQVRHRAALQTQALRQNGAAHAIFSTAQVNQNQGGVGLDRVQLGCEGAAHIGQRGEGADDQRHGRGHLFNAAFVVPDGTHRQ